MAHQKHAICELASFDSVVGHNNFTLLTLYEKASALTIDGFVLGSKSSRYVTKVHMIAVHPKYPILLKLITSPNKTLSGSVLALLM